MSWISYADDEVATFHPAFRAVAEEVLDALGLRATHAWEHHPHSAGVGVIPDFVLIERGSGRWVLVVEIKRRPDAVNSERSQIQAKGYAEANDGRYRVGRPRYFALCNLEVTQLFSLRAGLPPKDCRVDGMSFESGTFASTPINEHRNQFRSDLETLVTHCIEVAAPTFSTVWPRIARHAYHHADELPFAAAMDPFSAALPSLVRDYFAPDHQLSTRREMLIRCLLAEYLRGVLRRHDHPRHGGLHGVGTTLATAANGLIQMRSVDFAGVFEDGIPAVYLGLQPNAAVRASLEAYLVALQVENVSGLAATRGDSPTLPTVLLEEAGQPGHRDLRGKAPTDPELAALLASLAVTDGAQTVLDPGCGEGNLLSAAYDRLRVFKVDHAKVLDQLHGLEADTLAARVAALRLALKEPRLAHRTDPCHIRIADIFGQAGEIAAADVILMNPPFKRYEAQDEAPIPASLREHYRHAIKALGYDVQTEQGQANIFTLYVEFVVRAARQGSTIALVLDNKWYHNETSRHLRLFLLKNCSVLGIITYPHGRFFEGLMIATSMVVLRKGPATSEHETTFARTSDPSATSADMAAGVIRGGAVPFGWTVRRITQSNLSGDSWKAFFSAHLVNEYRRAPLRLLPQLFRRSRRGSLAKEGGGIAVYEFPARNQYGPQRRAKPGGAPFQTADGRVLTAPENARLRALADAIPDNYRGYAINKADRVSGYELVVDDVERDWTLETPDQRAALVTLYESERRVRWDAKMDALVSTIRASPETGAYVAEVERVVELDETVLPRQQLWNVLREPHAGELVIARKQRTGHRVHINPFALDPAGRQVRLSSNFLSYGGCLATDPAQGLDSASAARLIAAWLVSSFGHLQFEMEGNNREGARSLEQHHVDRIRVLDPRSIQAADRRAILDAFRELPYPIRTDVRAELQPELMRLDSLFADTLARLIPDFEPAAALTEVWDRLHDFHEARNH
ncbi:N-6 DNA Methylase [compost metagenome]